MGVCTRLVGSDFDGQLSPHLKTPQFNLIVQAGDFLTVISATKFVSKPIMLTYTSFQPSLATDRLNATMRI